MAGTNIQYTVTLRDLLTPALQNADREANKLESSLADIGKLAGIAFAGWGLKEIATDILDITQKMGGIKTALDFISSGQGSETFKFLTEYSEQLGLDLVTAAEGFKTISGAARGTSLEGAAVIEIFKGISEAGTVMRLSAEQQQGALMALGQIISKGKVQAEELRGQLGERIPGAFQIAARAMNMTTSELDKFMADGKLLAEDFLPRFAAQLRKEFSGGLDEASNSLTANINRMNNDIMLLKTQIGEDLTPVILGIISNIREFTASLADLWGWLKDNKQLLKDIGETILITGGLILAYVGWLKLVALWQGIVILVTGGLELAMYKLGIAIMANPIGILITVLGVLVGALVYCWNHFGRFRAVIYGVWAFLKEFVNFIKDSVIQVFIGLGEIILGALTFDVDKMQQGFTRAGNALYDGGVKLGQAFKKGYDEGLADFNKSIAEKQNPLAPKVTGYTPTKPAPTGTPQSTQGKATGQRVLNIKIDIGRLVEKIEINTTNLMESTAKVKEMVQQALLSAINDSQIVPER
jgi:tape measure domain-containing protein